MCILSNIHPRRKMSKNVILNIHTSSICPMMYEYTYYSPKYSIGNVHAWKHTSPSKKVEKFDFENSYIIYMSHDVYRRRRAPPERNSYVLRIRTHGGVIWQTDKVLKVILKTLWETFWKPHCGRRKETKQRGRRKGLDSRRGPFSIKAKFFQSASSGRGKTFEERARHTRHFRETQ